ncbi:MAG: EF-P lysine aminoacylase GenX [Gammaproteobacteria bacterium]|nr:EF-P lysine aminoacylase GenX [Gammaproteobacteria bacterium]
MTDSRSVTDAFLDWRPGAPLSNLRARAALLARIRGFFAARGVLEVETPTLSASAVTDPHLCSLQSRYTGPGFPAGYTLYLQTSPEFAMKRLLAAGSGPIYQLGKAYRDGETGRLHNPEFTLLEWYRPGFDLSAMMDEVETLAAQVLGLTGRFERVSYRELFRRRLGIDPFETSVDALRDCARRHGLSRSAELPLTGPDAWLDLLLTHFIEPGLGVGTPCFVHDYPPSQAALARIRSGPCPVAERFELYIDGMEIANGYHELGDPEEQRIRFERDRERRRLDGLPDVMPDGRLLAALAHGLPDCAGVALGVDRLVMAALGTKSIGEVVAFTLGRA